MKNSVKISKVKKSHNAILRERGVNPKKEMNTPIIKQYLKDALKNSKILKNARVC